MAEVNGEPQAVPLSQPTVPLTDQLIASPGTISLACPEAEGVGENDATQFDVRWRAIGELFGST